MDSGWHGQEDLPVPPALPSSYNARFRMPEPKPSSCRLAYPATFGCQMNVLDTQLVRGQLHALGYRFTDDWKAADVVLYNTCSVREQAENKVYSRIGEVGIHKRQWPGVILG